MRTLPADGSVLGPASEGGCALARNRRGTVLCLAQTIHSPESPIEQPKCQRLSFRCLPRRSGEDRKQTTSKPL